MGVNISPTRISGQNGKSVQTIVTDSQGHYEIALPEGRYLVTLPRPLSEFRSFYLSNDVTY